MDDTTSVSENRESTHASTMTPARTYHDTKSVYFLPNDAHEHRRLDDQSDAVVSMMMGKPFHAPLDGARKIVDVGCGTGAMTLRLAQENPQAVVYGVDFSAVGEAETLASSQGSNVEFIKGDFFDLLARDLRFSPGSLDYVFARMLVGAITDWPELIRRSFELLGSGGWIEIQEADWCFVDRGGHRVDGDWAWREALVDTGPRTGLDWTVTGKLSEYLRRAGFVDVQEKRYPATWSKQSWDEHPECDQVGVYSVDTLRPQFGDMLAKLYERSGYETENIEAFRKEISRTLDMECGSHMSFYSFWARKP